MRLFVSLNVFLLIAFALTGCGVIRDLPKYW
jgi:predicted small lipoprotein YifL